MNIPMRQKYVDEAVGVFMIFGAYEDGSVDVSTADRDVFTKLPQNTAQKVVDAQSRFRDELYAILCK